jgi:hypothetical protein
VVDEQRVIGLPLNRPSDALTVLRAERQGPEDEQVERTLQQDDGILGRHSTRV